MVSDGESVLLSSQANRVHKNRRLMRQRVWIGFMGEMVVKHEMDVNDVGL